MAFIVTTVEDRVATITIDRPDALNAFNTEVLRELLQEFMTIGHRTDVGAVILTGSGRKAFAAGADIAEMRDKSPDEGRSFAELGQMVTTTIERIPQPVIAAVNGYALGGGCEMALACDIRICSENARFGQLEINLGIIPGWGGSQRLVRLCGSGFARELIYTGRMVDAEEALRWGLVNAVYPQDELMGKAGELASSIAGKSGVMIQYAKACMNRAFDQDLAGGLRLEAGFFGLCFATEDQKEGMTAFLEKRPAEFKHR
ncbi:MAG: enoyl-CoA hydratase/isomerase family protein [Actinobacteria bacterium]|nr:enoyl-CoA hydratase/isomerase family protein [Actinomycetota bacterium]